MPKLVGDGNSLMAGQGVAAGSDPMTLLGLMRPNDTISNQGVASQTTAQMVSRYAATIAPLFVAGAIYLASETLNNVFFGASAATSASDMRTLCGLARATGYRVIAMTGSPTRGDFSSSQQNINDAANKLIRNEWREYADGFYDLAADLRFQDFNNLIYYQSDKVHYAVAGYQAFANGMDAAITASFLPQQVIRVISRMDGFK